MPNQLSIPFKKTYSVPLKQAVYNHIQARHPGTHPDAFRYDISQWESLRKEAISSVVHIDRTRSFITYANIFVCMTTLTIYAVTMLSLFSFSPSFLQT